MILKNLRVRDLALVEEAEVSFQPGLNLLTGETGSGKSLIIEALGLALGERAVLEQVRSGAAKAVAEARFVQDDQEVVLGREVGKRGTARLDGLQVTVRELAERAATLVSIHGQHDQQILLNPESQTKLLDSLAGNTPAVEAVATDYASWRAARDRLAALEQTQARGQREEEYLRWQLEELRIAQPQLGEDEHLEAERAVVRHAAKLSELTEIALTGLRAEEGVGSAAGALRQAAGLDPRLKELAERLELIEEEAAESATQLRQYADSIDADPARLEVIESRLAVLEQLKRKHGGSLTEVLREQERLEAQLGQGEDLNLAITQATQALSEARQKLEASSARLTELRAVGAERISRAVSAELQDLRLEGAVLEIRLHRRPEIGAEGAELAEFYFTANPGQALAPLANVASGGELSRVMLAIETVGAESTNIPILVFDEVDTGIGGETAYQVGRRLKKLGQRHQVLVVTHLAQIACFADHHLIVEKRSSADGRQQVWVRELGSRAERAAELARMMSGAVTEKALARAEELIDEAAVHLINT